MGIFEILTLVCGLALFLYGMDVMGDALKKSAGRKLKTILGNLTSNKFKGFLLGLGVTAIIQSSSATTVMVVGFVNSGTMTLVQAAGVVLGAGIGTTVTAWLTGLSGIEGAKMGVAALKWLKPSSWMPILAVIGIVIIMSVKRGRKRDIAGVLLGFVVLMTGMDIMSGAVESFGDKLQPILTMFENPFLALIAGMIFTAVIQSSSASIGILQALSLAGVAGGGITFSAAIPLIVGINIGTCITAILSALNANKDGKRSALLLLYYKIIYSTIILGTFYIVKIFVDMPFMNDNVNMWEIAIIHTAFNIIGVLVVIPFYNKVIKLVTLTIKDKGDDVGAIETKLDERLFGTPAIAVQQATKVTQEMSEIAIGAFEKSLSLLDSYDAKVAEELRTLEERVDMYEDALGAYLVKLSGYDLPSEDAAEITKLLHIIGDLERISDHSVNIVESAEEMKDKKISFSNQANGELAVIRSALCEILGITLNSFLNNNVKLATEVEPIEEVVDQLRDTIKLNHIIRLQKNECTIEHGFVLSDILNNIERVSDHCSNIAGCVIEISQAGVPEMHKYTTEISDSIEFKQKVVYYKQKYTI